MDRSVFEERRRRLLDRLAENGSAAAVLRAAPERVRSNDTHHVYRQDSDFFYLTGCAEPNAVCVLAPHLDAPFTLFVRPRDRAMETWEGIRLGVAGALSELGADKAHPIADLDTEIRKLLSTCDEVFVDLNIDSRLDHQAMAWIRQGRAVRHREGVGPTGLKDVGALLGEMRLVKSSGELDAMRRAAQISVEAHRSAMAACRPGVPEYVLEAELAYVFRRSGASGPAYPSIVASGSNATILHYVENTRTIEDGDLILIDAGSEFDHYASDVTRTFPASGRFSSPQRDVYQVVLEAQSVAIDLCRPGNSFEDLNRVATRRLVEGMVDLGLLSGEPDALIESGEHKRFYMHGIGHWLGMDVHDVGDIKVDGASRSFVPGMVVTVEPGIYVRTDEEDVPDGLRGIGVRIEDDVAIADGAPDNLTSGLAREIDEVEACVGLGVQV